MDSLACLGPPEQGGHDGTVDIQSCGEICHGHADFDRRSVGLAGTSKEARQIPASRISNPYATSSAVWTVQGVHSHVHETGISCNDHVVAWTGGSRTGLTIPCQAGINDIALDLLDLVVPEAEFG